MIATITMNALANFRVRPRVGVYLFQMIIKVNDNKRVRVIGDWNVELRTFKKKVKESIHLFRALDAWGIDAKFLNDVLVPFEASIEIHDMEKHKVYEVEALDFKKHGQYYHFKEDDGTDNRTQLFLPRSYFTIYSL